MILIPLGKIALHTVKINGNSKINCIFVIWQYKCFFFLCIYLHYTTVWETQYGLFCKSFFFLPLALLISLMKGNERYFRYFRDILFLCLQFCCAFELDPYLFWVESLWVNPCEIWFFFFSFFQVYRPSVSSNVYERQLSKVLTKDSHI